MEVTADLSEAPSEDLPAGYAWTAPAVLTPGQKVLQETLEPMTVKRVSFANWMEDKSERFYVIRWREGGQMIVKADQEVPAEIVK